MHQWVQAAGRLDARLMQSVGISQARIEHWLHVASLSVCCFILCSVCMHLNVANNQLPCMHSLAKFDAR